MNKKGSHVGMMLSFVIFVTSLVFLYSILQPTIVGGEDKSQLVKQVESKLPDYLNSDLFNLKISYGGCCEVQTCFYINKTKEVQLMNFIAKDKEGKIVDSFEEDGNVLLEKNSGNYTNVFFSNENFSKNLVTGLTLSNCYKLDDRTPKEYNSSFSSKKYAFESRILNFISNLSREDYYNDKKTAFGLPPGTEFSLAFTYSNGSKVEQLKNNISTNVFVNQVSIYYVNSSADISPGFIEVSVW